MPYDSDQLPALNSSQQADLLKLTKKLGKVRRISLSEIAKEVCHSVSPAVEANEHDIKQFLHGRKKYPSQAYVIKPLYYYINININQEDPNLDTEIIKEFENLFLKTPENRHIYLGPFLNMAGQFFKHNSSSLNEIEEKYYGNYIFYRNSSMDNNMVLSYLKIEKFSKRNQSSYFYIKYSDSSGRITEKEGFVFPFGGKLYFIGHVMNTMHLDLIIVNEHGSREIDFLNGLMLGLDGNLNSIASRIVLEKNHDEECSKLVGSYKREEIPKNIDRFISMIDNKIGSEEVLKEFGMQNQ